MKPICYPDGSPVSVGDIIWNNEGLNVRKVIHLLSPAEMEYTMGHDWGAGILWSRYIGERDLGALGCEAEEDFLKEGVGPLSESERLCIRLLFQLLGNQLGKQIWGSSSYLYYPVLYPEEQKDQSFRHVWYLFFQPYIPPVTSYDEEECYRFDEDRCTFVRVQKELQDSVRGL